MVTLRTIKGNNEGFTLLELLMVVIIVAILASLALPQYLRTVERARMSEAVAMLGQLRESEIRFRAESGQFTNNIAQLDFDPTDIAGGGATLFTYAVDNATAATFVISATRQAADPGAIPPIPAVGGNCQPNYRLTINELGVIVGRDCQQT